MPEHINEQQLKGYRDRTLSFSEQVEVDAHLGGCPPCRNALAALADSAPMMSVVSGIDQSRFQHLSYEQMDDWVEDRLDTADRELVMAHIGACAPCARQLIHYQEYAGAMAAPIRHVAPEPTTAMAVKQKVSFWAFLKQPHYALGAAALLAFFIITPLTRRSIPEQNGAVLAPTSTAIDSTIPAPGGALIEEAMSASELDALPDSLRAGAKETIANPEGAPRPAALKGLEPLGDTVLEFPYAEVVAETQPSMRWKPFGDNYTVSLYDARHALVSSSGTLRATQWMPPSLLTRDRVYSWEVDSAGQKHRGMFRVLSQDQLSELEKVRAEHGSSHLVMGAMSEQLGLLTQARHEFEAMGTSPQTTKLLNRIDALRKP
jgi:hypothetical protein